MGRFCVGGPGPQLYERGEDLPAAALRGPRLHRLRRHRDHDLPEPTGTKPELHF